MSTLSYNNLTFLNYNKLTVYKVFYTYISFLNFVRSTYRLKTLGKNRDM